MGASFRKAGEPEKCGQDLKMHMFPSFNDNFYVFYILSTNFLKKHIWFYFFRFRPIIPFESLMDLMNSSPRVSKLETVLSHDEVDLLKQKYDLEIVEDLYYVS